MLFWICQSHLIRPKMKNWMKFLQKQQKTRDKALFTIEPLGKKDYKGITENDCNGALSKSFVP